MKKINYGNCIKFLKKTIEILFFTIIIIYLIFCMLYQQNTLEFKITGLLPFIPIIAIYFVCFKIFSKIENKNLTLYRVVLFIFSIIIYGVWNIYAKTPAVSDYKVLIDGAKQILNGTFANLSFDKSNYFYFYNFQTGFVAYLALIMKIFGQRLLYLKLIEIIIMSLTNILIYEIASKVYSRKVGVVASIVYTLLLFNIAGASIVNNQHISTFFNVLAIFFFIKKKWQYNVLSGICLAIAIILRPSSIIFAIAFILFLIWKLLLNKLKDWKKTIISLFTIIIMLLGVVKIFDFEMVNKGLVPNSAVMGNVKYFKIVLGIYGGSIFGYKTENAEKTQLYFDLEHMNFDYEAYNNLSKLMLIDQLKNHFDARVKYVIDKMIIFCGGYDSQIDYAGEDIQDSNTAQVIKYAGYSQYILLLISAVSISLICILKNDNLQYESKNEYWDSLFKIIFIGYFLIHIPIEIQTRYRYDQYVMLSIIVSPLLSIIYNKIEEKLHNIKNRKIIL